MLNFLPHRAQSGGHVQFYQSEALLLVIAAILITNLKPANASPIAFGSIAAYSAWIAIAALMTIPEAKWQLLVRSLSTALIAWLSYRIAATIGRSGVSTIAGSATAWVGVLGIFACYNSINSNDTIVGPVGGLVGDSEMVAIQLSFLLPVALAYAIHGPPGNYLLQIGKWLAVLIGCTTLLMTMSRSGWIGGIVGLTIVAVDAWTRHRRSLKPWMLATTIIVLLATIVAAGTQQPLKQRSEFLAARLRSLVSRDLFSDRMPPWSSALSVLEKHPLFGDPQAPNSYSLFLGLASRSGWLALAFFLVAVFASVKDFFSPAFDSACKPLALGLVGGVIGFLVTGIGESSLGTRMTPLFFTVLGLLAGAYHSECSRTSASNNS